MLNKLEFDLQLFAGEDEKENENDKKENENDEKENENDEKENENDRKTYTQAELDEMLQKETDRRVSEAIKKREEKLKKDMEEEISRKLKDAERLSKLSADEKEKELMAQAKRDIEVREKAIKEKELLSDTKDRLYDEKIPVKFASILVKEDAETTNEAIKTFKSEWQKAIDDAVTERLKGKTPGRGGNAGAGTVNPFEKGKNFNLTAQAEIFKTDPVEAKRLQELAKNKN